MLINFRAPKVDKENRMIMKVQSEIIRSIKIQIIYDQDRDKTILMNIGDVVEIDYVDSLQMKTVVGKLVKFGSGSLTIDSSKEYVSNLTDILICNIRDIKDPNSKEEEEVPPTPPTDGEGEPPKEDGDKGEEKPSVPGEDTKPNPDEEPPKVEETPDKEEPVQPQPGEPGESNPDHGTEDNNIPKPPQEETEPPKKPEDTEGGGTEEKDPAPEHGTGTEDGKDNQESIPEPPKEDESHKNPEENKGDQPTDTENKLPVTGDPVIIPIEK